MGQNIEISWDTDEHKVLICTFRGDWTWHECREQLQQLVELAESKAHPINVVYDVSESTLSGRTLMANMQKLLALEWHPLPKKVIIIEKGFRMEMLTSTIEMLMPASKPFELTFAESMARARAMIG